MKQPNLLAAVCLCATAWAQTTINGSRTVLGDWDVSQARTTKPAKSGTSLPASCSVGEQYFKTDAPAGQNQYGCTSADTWTQLGGGTTITNLNQISVRDYSDLQNIPASFAPAAHKTTHATGGTDVLAPADIGAPALAGDGRIAAAQAPALTEWFFAAASTIGQTLSAANKIRVAGVLITQPVKFSRMLLSMSVVDSNLADYYDVGLYNTAFSLVAHTGPINLTTGAVDVPISGGSVTINPGKYYVAFTGNATTAAVMHSNSTTITFLSSAELAITSTGSTLPASISGVPADTWTNSAKVPWIALHN